MEAAYPEVAVKATDPGPDFVAAVREALLVDEAFSVDEPRGFSWWAHRLRQRITAGKPEVTDSGLACRVRVETDVLIAPRGGEPADVPLVELLRFPPLSAFVHDEAAERVRLFSAVTVGRDPAPHLAPLLAVAASLQATYAEAGLESLTRETRLEPAASAHPVSGPRPHPDGMLNLAAARIAPAGKDASRWARPEELFEAAGVPAIAPFGPTVDPRGFSVRLPFRENATNPLAPSHAALLQVRVDGAHAELGHGVFLRLFLPSGGSQPTAQAAMRLNALERDAGAGAPDALGAWTLERSEPELTGFAVRPGPPRLAYVLFLPNFVKVPELLRQAAASMERRAARAAAGVAS